MTGKKKRRDEPGEAIETALAEIRASLAGLAEQFGAGGAQHRLGTPVAFQPVFLPAMAPGEPAPTQNIPLG
ncbi:MAG TPA: hypothetical protein VD968_00195, partial [Pyrinomonadaceae bacterium]|nr:hypothetical protein [Pyrinomonadaceae bacterium]